MSKNKNNYILGASEQEDSINNARAMIGMDSEPPAIEIEAPRKVTTRRGGRMLEEDRPAFVKIYTDFKNELKDIQGIDLKVWIYLALSVNRFTGDACPGLRKIGEDLNLSVNTVRASLERLEEKALLEIEAKDGKRNLYRPSDYVSAKKETVSKTDTVPQTVSKSEGTVSVLNKTVSTQYRKSAQPEEPDIKPEGEGRSLDFRNMNVSEAQKLPTLKLYTDATNFFPGSVVWEYVHTTIQVHKLTFEKLHAAAVEWAARGYKSENVKGILEWAVNGIPNGNGSKPVQAEQKPAINDAEIERTKRMLAEKDARPFSPPPARVRDTIKQLTERKAIQK